MKRLALLLLALSPALATAAEEERSMAVTLARFIYPQGQYELVVEAATTQLASQIEGGLRAEGGSVAPDFGEHVRAEFRKFMPYAELVDLQAGLFAKYYDESELRELLAFYRTPIGQKSLRIMPEVMKDMMGFFNASFPKRMPAIMEGLKPYVHAGERKPAARTPAQAP